MFAVWVPAARNRAIPTSSFICLCHQNFLIPCDPSVSLLSINLKILKSVSQRHTCTPTSITAFFTRTKIWKQPKCPLRDKKIKKMGYTHTMKYYSALKKKEILPYVRTWMSLEEITLREISQVIEGQILHDSNYLS